MKKATSARTDAKALLIGFIGKFAKTHQTLLRAVRKELHRRFPTACELVYDNYDFLVLGYAPTERPSDAIVSMAAGANGVGLSPATRFAPRKAWDSGDRAAAFLACHSHAAKRRRSPTPSAGSA